MNQGEGAHIGKSVLIKGELSGSENLFVDGEVEGRIELPGSNLVIGPNGRIKANIQAREVVVNGKVDGNITASERVELRKTASLSGDIVTARIIVEEGAFFKGSIDIQRESASRAAEAKPAVASVTTSQPAQGSLIRK
jgi:cytoskeletal protein CcmA (bactofilin family)